MQAKHLAIVRAALTFWDEEMATAPESVYQHYLHSKDKEASIAASEVAETRRFFNEVDLRFALIEKKSGELVPGKLVNRRGDLPCQSTQRIVSVLFR